MSSGSQATTPKKSINLNPTLFPYLPETTKQYLLNLDKRYGLTFQEFRILSETARDLDMWGEASLETLWQSIESNADEKLTGPTRKKYLLSAFKHQIENIRDQLIAYETSFDKIRKPKREPLHIETVQSDKKIYGDCPVASDETVCCNLKTIDSVENCAFGCSYCTIQTFYGEKAIFDSGLKKKLDRIAIEADRFYHFGTGQSSDALVWGNREGILDHLTAFAAKHPNILLEFKTKSDNIAYFLDHKIPKNVVCSWSLNTEAVIQNEEHFTANLNRRLEAARKVADQGIKVAFHFHPIVYYKHWKNEYGELTKRVLTGFRPEEVLFISLGSVTFIKPVIQAIRKRGEPTQILGGRGIENIELMTTQKEEK